MVEVKAAPLWGSARLTLAIMSFFGFINFYALRVNMSIAIVCMVNHTAIRLHEQSQQDAAMNETDTMEAPLNATINRKCSPEGTDDFVPQDGELNWDKETQAFVHGSLFWGYLLTNILGGYLASRFGGKHVIGFALFAAALLTFPVPVVSRTNPQALMALRFLTGITQGFVSPAMQSLLSYWAPPLESSRMRSICFAGSQIGRALTYPVAALLCEYGFDGGWPSIFYLQATYGVLWFVGWYYLVYDSPAVHPRISNEEKLYIESSLEGRMQMHKEKRPTPWRGIFTSVPVWVLIVAHTCSNWGDYTFLTNIPTYMKEVLQFNIKENGFFSALPYVCFWFAICISSWLADLVGEKNLLTTTGTRKVFNSIGSLIPAGLLIILSYIDCTNSAAAVTVLSLGVSLTGFQYGGGIFINPGDIAPQYAGLLYGISNTVATIPGFLAPLAIGFLTKDQTLQEWRHVFFLSAGIMTFGALIYIAFGTGHLQPWASPPTREIVVEKEESEHSVTFAEAKESSKYDGEGSPGDNDTSKKLLQNGHKTSEI